MEGMNRTRTVALAGSLLFLTLLGCGYHLEGRGTSLPPEIGRIAIPTMRNQTLEAGIEDVFTRALIREFNLDGRLKTVREEQADAVLEGSILDFSTSSVSYDATGLALENRIQVTLALALRDVGTGEILWEDASLPDFKEYRVGSTALDNEARKREAVEEIARQMAETIHDLIVERF
jgi:outer membrane lipopolysaccharide assembly protein LptE/RlpB